MKITQLCGRGTIMAVLAVVVPVFGLAVETPSVAVSAMFKSRKVERGMVENRDPVFGWDAEIDWQGFHVCFDACHDMTDIDGRRGRFNELETCAGYEYAPFDWLEVVADYSYKHETDGHTHEIEAGCRFPLPWCVPFCRMNIDVDKTPGALYGVLGAFRDIVLLDVLTITPTVGMGFGNVRRNEADFECHRDAARDVHAGLAIDWEVVPHVHLCPSVMLFDQFTTDGRRESFGNGFFCVVGCAVNATF